MGNQLDNLGVRYKIIIKWALSHRRLVVFSVTGIMVLSLIGVPFIGAEFMPASDSGQISIRVEADKGTLIDDMEKMTIQIEDVLLANPNVDVVFTSIGSSGRMSMSSSVNEAAISLKLVPQSQRKDSVQQVADEIRNSLVDISGVKTTVSIDTSMFGSMGSGGAINLAVQGNDLDTLKEIASQVESIVRQVPGTREVASSLTSGDPEVQIRINRQRAVDYGFTPAQITSEIKNAIDGVVATTYRSDGKEIDVRVFSKNNQAQTLESLAGLKILTSQGTPVDLKELTTFELSRGPVQISRADQVRQATITGELFNRDLNSVMEDIQRELKQLPLPSGYEIKLGGDSQSMAESFSGLLIALLLAILLVYVVMVVQYESFSDPFVIMLSMPTAIIGVILALLITGMSFSVNAFIGIIMLAGIVVSNAIILIDYLKKLRESGMDKNEAIIEAGGTRLRPILMTALTTILAMVPMSLGLGEGGETNAPLATVVIGGLLVSTFITLILVPVVYSIFDDWIQKRGKKKQGRLPEETIIAGS